MNNLTLGILTLAALLPFSAMRKLQLPGRAKGQARARLPQPPEVSADLAQLMWGVFFPNSNVIFFAQE